MLSVRYGTRRVVWGHPAAEPRLAAIAGTNLGNQVEIFQCVECPVRWFCIACCGAVFSDTMPWLRRHSARQNSVWFTRACPWLGYCDWLKSDGVVVGNSRSSWASFGAMVLMTAAIVAAVFVSPNPILHFRTNCRPIVSSSVDLAHARTGRF